MEFFRYILRSYYTSCESLKHDSQLKSFHFHIFFSLCARKPLAIVDNIYCRWENLLKLQLHLLYSIFLSFLAKRNCFYCNILFPIHFWTFCLIKGSNNLKIFFFTLLLLVLLLLHHLHGLLTCC